MARGGHLILYLNYIENQFLKRLDIKCKIQEFTHNIQVSQSCEVEGQGIIFLLEETLLSDFSYQIQILNIPNSDFESSNPAAPLLLIYESSLLSLLAQSFQLFFPRENLFFVNKSDQLVLEYGNLEDGKLVLFRGFYSILVI